MTKNKTRSINNIDPAKWNTFVAWSKLLGMKQNEFFAELLRFYFDGNNEKMAKLAKGGFGDR